ncbi:iron uptake porin [Leptolyngbya sp. FACHB-36]|uniref:iron uptake porin n=1 Tax=Leptolyngbya sp. FACHB-36 TaxID=2692808 RepID=UPI001680AEA5|nr:iron uptake porin [Leptolyngbya sp. FACHB-36]MBD2020506.1 iron uptake porin [Leptolyngbya sp. FACHB-36]
MTTIVGRPAWALLVISAALAPVVANAAPVTTDGQDPTQSSDSTAPLEQVTSVSQLSDVRPTDWAFQALQSLVERYGCIVGYPDQTYRGNRALTRYEFAAGLNACIDRVNELIAAATADLVKKEDLVALQKLQEEFAAELASLRGRIDAVETRTATLERQLFSTTTKLVGEVILSIAGVFGDDRALNSDQQRVIDAAPAATREAVRNGLLTAGGNSREVQDNPVFTDRVRLNLVTSFTGKDQLITRLEANNTSAFNAPVTGTAMTRLGYDSTAPFNDNAIRVGKLLYRFPLGSKTTVTVDAIGGEFFDNVEVFNPFLYPAPTGSISRFGRHSPIYRLSNTGSYTNTGAGLTLTHKFTDALGLSLSYLARNPFDPNANASSGLFDGTYAALAQLNIRPSQNFGVGLTYVRAYYSGKVRTPSTTVFANDVSTAGATGSAFANQPFGLGVGANTGVATSVNAFGIEASYRVTPRFNLSGWVGYTEAIAEDGSGLVNVRKGDRATIWNWSVGLAFPDLLRKGDLIGIVVGQPPKATDNDYGPTATGARREDRDTSFHLEGFYRYQLTNNLSITPGVLVIFNPEHNSDNDTQVVGVIRTTFRF